jgi:ligand-binding sensor domain-containing protein
VRYFDGSIWIVTDAQIVAYTVDDDGLTLRDVFAVKGARDVDMLRDNYLAVAGSFGRAVYRIHPDSNGPGDTFVMAHREPGLLTHAVTDQLQILAGAPEQGTWLYQIGSDASLLDQTLNRQPPTSRDAVIDAGTAAISDDLKSITLRKSNNAVSWQHPGQHQLHCVIAVEGRLWVGHERGVAVLDVEQPSTDEIAAAVKNEQPPPQPRLAIVEDIWLHGPVRYVFALLTGRGAAYVATYGGFGTVEFLEEAIPVPAE